MDLSAFLSPEDDDALQSEALMEALRRQQEKQEEERAGLRSTLSRQQGQAGNLRTLSLLTSMGDNPLLRGIQRASGEQGSQLEGLAARTEQRLSGTSGGMNPLALERLKQSAQRLGFQQKAGAEKLELARQNLARLQRQAGMAEERAGKKDMDTAIDRESGLRREFNALPEVKDFADLSTSFQNLRASVKDKSGPGGVATIFNFMKMLDPGVAVMQGDVDLIRNSGGPAAKFANLYEQALTGNPLPESVLKNLEQQATVIYSNRKRQVDALRQRYGEVAEQVGAAPERVVIPRGVDIDLDAPKRPASQSKAPAATADGPRIVSVKGMKPGDLAKSLQEGETVRVNMGGGKYQTVRKKGGKLVKVKE